MNKTCKTNKDDHSQIGSTTLKFHLKINHPNNDNPEYPQLCTKKKQRKEKRAEKGVGTIIPR